MSELAYNLQGERFEPPSTAAVWRVRRLKSGGRGTPDVVYGDDGAPLMIPMETELVAFRQLVSHEPGRYRLDPVDEDHRACDGAVPAYLHIGEAQQAAPTPAPVAVSAGGEMARMMEKLIEANTEMVRNISEKFASVMESAATLIRAADGAGIPARQPVVLPPAQVVADDEDDDDPEALRNAAEPPPRSFGEAILTTAIREAAPVLRDIAMKKFAGGAPAQPRNAAGAGVPFDNQTRDAAGFAEAAAGTEETEEAEAGTSGAMPTLAPHEFVHFAAVREQLTPNEQRVAFAIMQELTSDERTKWIRELCALSVEGATAKVRDVVARYHASGKPGTTENRGAS